MYSMFQQHGRQNWTKGWVMGGAFNTLRSEWKTKHFVNIFKCIFAMDGGWELKVVTIFNHVGGSFNVFMATTGDVWTIPSFRI